MERTKVCLVSSKWGFKIRNCNFNDDKDDCILVFNRNNDSYCHDDDVVLKSVCEDMLVNVVVVVII